MAPPVPTQPFGTVAGEEAANHREYHIAAINIEVSQTAMSAALSPFVLSTAQLEMKVLLLIVPVSAETPGPRRPSIPTRSRGSAT